MNDQITRKKLWVARDENGNLWLYRKVPRRYFNAWGMKRHMTEGIIQLPTSWLPNVKWSDSKPTLLPVALRH